MPSVKLTVGVVSVELDANEASVGDLGKQALAMVADAMGTLPRSEQVGFVRSGGAVASTEVALNADDPCPECGHRVGWVHLSDGGCRAVVGPEEVRCPCRRVWPPIAAA